MRGDARSLIASMKGSTTSGVAWRWTPLCRRRLCLSSLEGLELDELDELHDELHELVELDELESDGVSACWADAGRRADGATSLRADAGRRCSRRAWRGARRRYLVHLVCPHIHHQQQ